MTLDIWEAQFGDFANGAQVVIDQFLSSGEAKWGRLCGLALFLPHGYEGQGPEHSSARLERFLQLCALDNMLVCTPTTPAQAFHMIRRQQRMDTRKPLVVMTPKSLLRHKLAVSTLDELANGRVPGADPREQRLAKAADLKKVKRVVVCGGKVYYDLIEEAQKRKLNDVAIVRVEQLYPFPRAELVAELQRFAAATEVVWCQEEPQNQGAWYQIQHHLRACLQPKQTLNYAGRVRSPSPAAGHLAEHVAEQTAARRRRAGQSACTATPAPNDRSHPLSYPGRLTWPSKSKFRSFPNPFPTRPSRPGTRRPAKRSSATKTCWTWRPTRSCSRSPRRSTAC